MTSTDGAAGPAGVGVLAGISPVPASADEVVAIMAAVEALWPRPVVVGGATEPNGGPSEWRFSGRWWSRPVSARRDRPWRR